jgi:ornithine carbamoyltransferase
MALNLKNRHFLSLRDFTPGEIGFLLKLSAALKAAKYAGTEQPGLHGKEFALIFEKDSPLARAGFEVAAHDQGAHVTYLGSLGTRLGRKETVKDTARVLGCMFDGIEVRGVGQAEVEELALHARVPVWNGLTDEFHPTQVLADLLTMQEHAEKPLRDIAFTFMGDTASNIADSLLIGGAKMGMDVRLCGPRDCWPQTIVEAEARSIAHDTGARILISDNIDEATLGADFIYTDAWLGKGAQRMDRETWVALLKPYQVTADIMADTGNPRARFMYCLPAFHRGDAEITKEFGQAELEVTDAVFESRASVVFDQAENRLHTIKAVLVATLTG